MELQGNLNRAQSLQQLRHIEMVRHQFRKLRIYLDKHTLSSPRIIQIPNDDGTSSSITDTTQMHQTIMSHNQRHFNQAQGSPPTISPLKNILGDGLDNNSQQILDGKVNLPTHIPNLMSQFLKNLKKTHHHDEPPIFPQDQIIQAFKNGRDPPQHHRLEFTLDTIKLLSNLTELILTNPRPNLNTYGPSYTS